MELYPTSYVVVISILFVLESIVGLGFNSYTLVKWFRSRKTLQRRRKKRCGCNFVISQMILDFVICATVIPVSLFVQMISKDDNLIPCLMKEGLVIMASSGSSVCIMLISVDRYAAVVLPTRPIMTVSRVKICNICVCIVAAMGSTLPYLCFLMGSYSYGINESVKYKSCRRVIWIFKPFFLYDLFYILPFVVAIFTTGVCYKAVLKVVKDRLRKRIFLMSNNSMFASSSSTANVPYFARFRRQELKVQRVAFGATLSFLFCWGPHVAITTVQIVLPEAVLIDMIQAACLSLAFLSPVIQPVLYTYQFDETRVRGNLTIFAILSDFLRLRRRNVVAPSDGRPAVLPEHQTEF